jgi:NAD+ diphosphatase
MTDSNYPLDLTRRPPNFFAFGGVDRLAHVRNHHDWLDELLAQPETRLVPVWRSRNLFADMGNRAMPPSAGFPTAGEASRLVDLARYVVFLGDFQGIAHIGIDLSPLDEETVNLMVGKWGQFSDLREIGPLIERFEGAVMAYARGLMFWHSRHGFCGICGHETVIAKGGHQRNCTNSDCGASHFPRTDPAVIMLVHDGDRALLGRQKIWPAGMYSTLAGFVEPGESLEEAVAREVFEEAGIEIRDVRYHSSQPWPFPCSLMLGFHAEAKSTTIKIDEDEIDDAQWFSRDEMRNFDAQGKYLPRQISISRRLIEDWLAGDA